MNRKPKLLFLAQTLPYPTDSGVAIRTYNIMRLLSRRFDLTALCFYRRKSGEDASDIPARVAALEQFGRIEAFAIPQEHSRLRLVWDHMRSLLLRRVYTRFAYESRAYEDRLQALLKEERFDLVHMDSLDLVGYVPNLANLPVVVVHHNVESELLRRRASRERSYSRRNYLRFQARLYEREERMNCARFALNVAVSQDDQLKLLHLGQGANFSIVPNGVDCDYFRPGPQSGSSIAFLGGMGWFPNRDAIEFFSSDILPRLRALGVDNEIEWVGHASSEDVKRYRENSGINVTGYVEDIRPAMHAAGCFIVPLRVGGGTRLKIVTAWALGKAVVSTSLGCEGLDAVDGENILIRDDPDGFAEAVRDTLSDSVLRRKLEIGGRRTAEGVYSWEVIGENMLESYVEILRGRSSATSLIGTRPEPTVVRG